MTDYNDADVKALQMKHRASLERLGALQRQTKDKKVLDQAKQDAHDAGNAWTTAQQTLDRQKKGITSNTGAAQSLFGGLFGR